MTAVAPPSRAVTSSTARLLRLDGGLCAALGLPAAIAPGPVADLLGTDATGVVRVVGVALVLCAAGLVAGSRARWARRLLTAAAVGNVGWEVVSLGVAALADLGTAGRVLVAVQGLVVGALAVVQLRSLRG